MRSSWQAVPFWWWWAVVGDMQPIAPLSVVPRGILYLGRRVGESYVSCGLPLKPGRGVPPCPGMARTKMSKKRAAEESGLSDSKRAKHLPAFVALDGGTSAHKVRVDLGDGNTLLFNVDSAMYYSPEESRFYFGSFAYAPQHVQIINLKMALGKTAEAASEVLGLPTRTSGGLVEVCLGGEKWEPVVRLYALSMANLFKVILSKSRRYRPDIALDALRVVAVIPSKLDLAFEGDVRSALRLCKIQSDKLFVMHEAEAVAQTGALWADEIIFLDLGAGTLDACGLVKGVGNTYNTRGYRSAEIGGKMVDLLIAEAAFLM